PAKHRFVARARCVMSRGSPSPQISSAPLTILPSLRPTRAIRGQTGKSPTYVSSWHPGAELPCQSERRNVVVDVEQVGWVVVLLHLHQAVVVARYAARTRSRPSFSIIMFT